jgi:hypothetical protein
MEPRPRSEQSKKPLPKKKTQERMKAAAEAAAKTGGQAAG